MAVTLRPVCYADALPLVDALADELMVRYGGGEPSHAHPEQFEPPSGTFLVAAVDGVDVACGGVRPLAEGVAEVKRMYVDPGHRGRGLARAVLAALADHARSAGFRELWLETGTAQPEAMALYESAGFVPIAPYGQHKDHPASRCYRLVLG